MLLHIVVNKDSRKGKNKYNTCTSAIAWSAKVVFPLLSGPNIWKSKQQIIEIG